MTDVVVAAGVVLASLAAFFIAKSEPKVTAITSRKRHRSLSPHRRHSPSRYGPPLGSHHDDLMVETLTRDASPIRMLDDQSIEFITPVKSVESRINQAQVSTQTPNNESAKREVSTQVVNNLSNKRIRIMAPVLEVDEKPKLKSILKTPKSIKSPHNTPFRTPMKTPQKSHKSPAKSIHRGTPQRISLGIRAPTESKSTTNLTHFHLRHDRILKLPGEDILSIAPLPVVEIQLSNERDQPKTLSVPIASASTTIATAPPAAVQVYTSISTQADFSVPTPTVAPASVVPNIESNRPSTPVTFVAGVGSASPSPGRVIGHRRGAGRR